MSPRAGSPSVSIERVDFDESLRNYPEIARGTSPARAAESEAVDWIWIALTYCPTLHLLPRIGSIYSRSTMLWMSLRWKRVIGAMSVGLIWASARKAFAHVV
jgi:hypothetical protein